MQPAAIDLAQTCDRPLADLPQTSGRPGVDLRGPGGDLALAGSDPVLAVRRRRRAGAVKFAAACCLRRVHGSTPQVHARYTGWGTRPRPSIGWMTASRGLGEMPVMQEPGWLAAVTTGRGDEREAHTCLCSLGRGAPAQRLTQRPDGCPAPLALPRFLRGRVRRQASRGPRPCHPGGQARWRARR